MNAVVSPRPQPPEPPPESGHSPSGDRAPAAPRSLFHLFIAFTVMALQGFGGVLAIVQREMVERRRWMTLDEFVEEWAVAQVMPGPNVVNLGIIFGGKHFGWRGSVVAVAGLLCAPSCIVLSLALSYAHFNQVPQVQAALRGMAAVAAGLIAATGLKLVPALAKHPLGWRTAALFSVLTFIAIVVLRLPLAVVIFGIGGLCCVLTWRRLAPAQPPKEER